LPFTFLSFLQ